METKPQKACLSRPQVATPPTSAPDIIRPNGTIVVLGADVEVRAGTYG